MIGSDAAGATPDDPVTLPPETTGRMIVVFEPGGPAPRDLLERTAGLAGVASSRELTGDRSEVTSTDTVFEELGIAVVAADPDQTLALRSAGRGVGILSVSPELIHHVRSGDYVQGYTDGVRDLGTRLGATESGPPGAASPVPTTPPTAAFQDTDEATWGIQAVGADRSTATGAGIRIAVLDTGFDSGHPDFVGRTITAQSFVPGESAEDGHGHGTHCTGTACGPLTPGSGPRYGVATEAEILIGKVLSNAGSGSDGGILAGIDWAVQEGCAVVSMSLGADVSQSHPPYTAAGQRSLDKGTLIVAAAGNNARRQDGDHGFVGAPANSPFILAVGALDGRFDLAWFSARTLADARGGQVDLAGPGLDVYSAWPMPTRYRSISGTSMATPHIAGLAALWAQVTGLRGRDLWAVLTQESTRLSAPSVDVGSGLTLAP